MSNHVHLVLIPQQAESLALALKQTHGRYASFWNATHASSGHVWQGRYYSCPLDDTHLWIALRYVERNPVRAGLVATAESWPWSSAPTHCGQAESALDLDMEKWMKRWTGTSWQAFLLAGETVEDLTAIRENTHTGRPLGTPEFVKQLAIRMCYASAPDAPKRGTTAARSKERRRATGDRFWITPLAQNWVTSRLSPCFLILIVMQVRIPGPTDFLRSTASRLLADHAVPPDA